MEGRRIPPPPPPRPFVPNGQTGEEGVKITQSAQNLGAQPSQTVPIYNNAPNQNAFAGNPQTVENQFANNQNAPNYQFPNQQTAQNFKNGAQNVQQMPKDRTKIWAILSAIASALCFCAGLAFLILMFI